MKTQPAYVDVDQIDTALVDAKNRNGPSLLAVAQQLIDDRSLGATTVARFDAVVWKLHKWQMHTVVVDLLEYVVEEYFQGDYKNFANAGVALKLWTQIIGTFVRLQNKKSAVEMYVLAQQRNVADGGALAELLNLGVDQRGILEFVNENRHIAEGISRISKTGTAFDRFDIFRVVRHDCAACGGEGVNLFIDRWLRFGIDYELIHESEIALWLPVMVCAVVEHSREMQVVGNMRLLLNDVKARFAHSIMVRNLTTLYRIICTKPTKLCSIFLGKFGEYFDGGIPGDWRKSAFANKVHRKAEPIFWYSIVLAIVRVRSAWQRFPGDGDNLLLKLAKLVPDWGGMSVVIPEKSRAWRPRFKFLDLHRKIDVGDVLMLLALHRHLTKNPNCVTKVTAGSGHHAQGQRHGSLGDAVRVYFGNTLGKANKINVPVEFMAGGRLRAALEYAIKSKIDCKKGGKRTGADEL